MNDGALVGQNYQCQVAAITLRQPAIEEMEYLFHLLGEAPQLEHYNG